MEDDEQLLLYSSYYSMIRHSFVSRINRIFISLCLFGCLFVVVFVNEKYGSHVYLELKDNSNERELFEFVKDLSKPKHLHINIQGWCSGISNMLFRIASLYGIGKQVYRIPCIEGKCAEKYQDELHSAFPKLTNFPMRKKCWPEEEFAVPFADQDPRIYENPSVLSELNGVSNLKLTTSYLQSVKFFGNFKSEIKEMFKFDDLMNKRVDKYATTLFKDEDSSNPTKKLCIHMRRTDFLSSKQLPLLGSLLEFTLPALFYVSELAMDETNNHFSVLLFSDDIKFSKTIQKDYKMFNNDTKVYIPDTLKRLEYMNLASRYCDYYILTASGSTYGWWTAYLLDESKQNKVFYNARMFRPHKKNSAKVFVEDNFFPKEWRRLVLNKNTSIVFEQDRKIVPLVPI